MFRMDRLGNVQNGQIKGFSMVATIVRYIDYAMLLCMLEDYDIGFHKFPNKVLIMEKQKQF